MLVFGLIMTIPEREGMPSMNSIAECSRFKSGEWHMSQVESNATRSHSGKSHDDHALGVLGHVYFLPGRLGVVLGCKQHFVDCPTVGNYAPN